MKLNLNPLNWFKSEVAAAPVTGAALPPPMPPMRPEYLRAFRQLESQLAETHQKLTRSYDAAVTDNYNADFKGTFGAANAELLISKYTARSRSRTLAKDDPHGKVVVRTFADNVVGDDPFELELQLQKPGPDGKPTADKALNDVVTLGWNEFGKEENFTVTRDWSFMEAMRMVEASRVREGSVLCRMYRGYAHNKFGFAVRFVEEDRLQESYMGLSPNESLFGGGNPIRFSIERHPQYDFPLAYWLLTRHPGDVFLRSPLTPAHANVWREQVPADEIIHFNNLRDRAEQDIGMTELDATIQPLWRNRQYDKSLVLAAIASCMKPFVLEKKVPTGLGLPSEFVEQMMNSNGVGGPLVPAAPGQGDAAQAQQNIGTPGQLVKPGMERELPFGTEAKILDPKFPVEAAHEFRQDNLRDIAVGSGVTYQHISGDFQNLGFIAGLMCQQPFQRYMRVRQNHLIGKIERLFREWLTATILSGYFEREHGVTIPIARVPEICRAAHFKGEQWEFVNPLVEAQALILLCQNGHLTRQQVQDRLPNGVKLENLFEMLEQEQLAAEQHHLDFTAGELTRPNAGEPGEPDAGAAEGDRPPAKQKLANPVRAVVTVHPRMAPDTVALLAESNNGHH